MSQHLDRIRRTAGLATVPAAPLSHAAVRPHTVATLLEAATPTRTDLTSFQIPAASAAAAAVLAAPLHRFAFNKLAMNSQENGHTLQRIAVRILDFGGSNVWAPWVAGAALVVLAVVAIHTHGFSS